MSSKSMTSKAKIKAPTPKPKTTGARVIDFDALLGNWPTIVIDGVSIIGREMTTPEAKAWRDLAGQEEDLDAQYALIHRYVTARGADVTLEWTQTIPRSFWDYFILGIIAGQWPDQEEGAEGK